MNEFMNPVKFFAPNMGASKVEKSNSAFVGGIALGAFAIIALLIYSISIGFKLHSAFCVLKILSILMLMAFASFACGGVVGFLFGIPRTLQHSNGNSPDQVSETNTNLEQISDWLTKILVGVGLTQIHKIIIKFNDLSYNLGHALEPEVSATNSAPIASIVLILFSIDGFLIVYLWTRLFLAKIQDSSFDDKLNIRDTLDKEAISIANTQMNLPVGVKDNTVDELYNVFKKASGTTISNIYFKAISIRKQYWKIDKNKIERVIPVFRGLIKLDINIDFPENFAELGYALKDKQVPEYKEAIDNFSAAIEGFKKLKRTDGIGIVYFNRAYCRVKSDSNFNQNLASNEDIFTLIKADLDEASKEDYLKEIIFEDEIIQAWLTLNKR